MSDQILIDALKKIDQKVYDWVEKLSKDRNFDAPFWNLGYIAKAALKKYAEKPVSSAFPKYSVVPFDGSTWMVYEDGVGEVCLCSDYESTGFNGEARANMICAMLNSQASETGEWKHVI